MKDHSKLAMELFEQGYNCSQSVFAAFHEDLNIGFEMALKLSSSFGGGMGKLREVCGAVSGMFMIAGLKYGYANPNDINAKAEHYKLIQELAGQFKEENNSIICRELLGLSDGADSTIPENRTSEYYKNRPCIKFVGCAARIIEELINKKEASQ